MNIDWYILSWIQDNLRCIFLDWLMPLISAPDTRRRIPSVQP